MVTYLISITLMKLKEKIQGIYEQKYKLLLFFSLTLVALALLQIGIQYAMTGDFVHKGISLKGGSTITITDTSVNIQELQQFLSSRFPTMEISVRVIGSVAQPTALAIDSDVQKNEEIDALLSALKEKVDISEASVEIVGSSLGESFFRQTAVALLVAFLLMGIVVFAYFRVPVPSLAVIAAAFSDIVVTLAIFNLTGEKLTSAGVAAFLMLVGYSVDTDILLTNRVLRREGQVMDKIYSAIKTGLTMTLTTLAAVLVALLLVNNDVVKQIMLILFIGLIVDMIMTWVQNTAILRLYLERKGVR